MTGYTVVTRESEWDDDNRDWATALTLAEENRCPVCGGPMNECTDPENEFKWAGTGPIRCHRSTATAERQAQFFGKGSKPPEHAEALMWGVKIRGT